MANSIESERFIFLIVLIFALGIVVIYHNVRINEVKEQVDNLQIKTFFSDTKLETLECLPDLTEHIELTTYALRDSVVGSSADSEY